MAEDFAHEVSSHLSGHALSKKMGPLPVWGWGVILGGIVVAYMYFHHSSSNAAAATPVSGGSGTPVDPASGLPEVTGTPLGSSPSGSGDGYGSYDPYTPPTEPAGNSTPIPPMQITVDMPANHKAAHPFILAARHAKTNKGWATHIRKALLAHGYRPFVVNHALHNYLTGKRLTAPQHDAIAQAHAWALPPHRHTIPAMHVHTQTEPHGGQSRKHAPQQLTKVQVHRRRVYYAHHHHGG